MIRKEKKDEKWRRADISQDEISPDMTNDIPTVPSDQKGKKSPQQSSFSIRTCLV